MVKGRLMSRAEFGSLQFDDEVKDQIMIRRDLIQNQMVGWLYPSILCDEIADLQELNRPVRPEEEGNGNGNQERQDPHLAEEHEPLVPRFQKGVGGPEE